MVKTSGYSTKLLFLILNFYIQKNYNIDQIDIEILETHRYSSLFWRYLDTPKLVRLALDFGYKFQRPVPIDRPIGISHKI